MKKLLLALTLALSTPTFAQSPALSNAAKLRQIHVVTDPAYAGGAKCDGSTNDATAIQAALNSGAKKLVVPNTGSACLVSSQLTIPANVTLEGEGKNAGTCLKKNFNGDLILLGAGAGLRDLCLDGNKASFTGRNVIISSGSGQWMDNITSVNSQSFDVEYTVADIGSQSFIVNSQLGGYSPHTAVKYPVDTINAHPRAIINTQGGGSILVDFNGALDSYFGFNFTNGLTFSSSGATNTIVIGNRIATAGGTTTIDGSQGHFIGNVFAGPVVLAASSFATVFEGNLMPSDNITNSGTGNSVITSNRIDMNGSGTFVARGPGPNAIGGAPQADARLRVLGAFTGSTATYGIINTDTLTGPVNGDVYGVAGFATLNKAGSGTHALFAQMYLEPPTIGGGGATVTNAATLNINGQPSGATNNYSLRVASGSSLFGAQMIQKAVTLTYSASITPDASQGNIFTTTATNGVAFTINAPTNPATGQKIRLRIRNTSGGALGALTLNAVFKIGAAWVQPATGFSRAIDFDYDGTNWIEASRAAADVTN